MYINIKKSAYFIARKLSIIAMAPAKKKCKHQQKQIHLLHIKPNVR